MILDKQSLLSDQQAITASAASTNVIDLGAPGKPVRAAANLKQDVGNSDIPLLIQVTEDFDELTSLTIAVQTGATDAFSPAATLVSTVVPLASLKAGFQASIAQIPRNAVQRYLRIYYTVTGSAPTAGKITAGVVSAIQSNS